MFQHMHVLLLAETDFYLHKAGRQFRRLQSHFLSQSPCEAHRKTTSQWLPVT